MRGAKRSAGTFVYPEVGKRTGEMRDTFLGVRFLSATSVQAIDNMSACLTDIIHSQSFSLSQRFTRLDFVALFHATAAHRILVSRVFPSQAALAFFNARYSHAVKPAPNHPGLNPVDPIALIFN